MIEEITICPYTGLRPFTEDESIYFKGRDEHIDQATKQLQKNKFIMLTGASGDGKSSLVFAGILPNARAGFLKSQFSSWAVAQFRPEREPLKNLSEALAKQLGIANENTVQTELSHGFSSLVDMYKASMLYADVNDADWHDADEKEKTTRKRRAANLIIVADQFEEFFTNPENFQKGIPSQEANLVTNLLLETARIALDENLPIYVVITMRSDFIGQCASFRGLPEAIGFSQFFVPRLNRTQLQEVIEEPALLSGNTISRRLTERLIHDMVEGTDQLPILQHAMNQIWKMADEGRTEMDLIHYAMVGGMTAKDLPEADISRFDEWFSKLPEKIQACYEEPDLQNVLNTHANKLYTFAPDYLKEQYNEEISDSDSKLIIETAFKCLTKIDNGRAVRNRMTLAEITAIINVPHLTFKKIDKVLNIFREPGNTLVRPFLEDEPVLNADSVLDITHESLIRNWEKLDLWAKEEFANYTTFLDFNQQLNRWVESGKSSSFLLYIGPLTYFENFFNKSKPNLAWIARYLGEESTYEQQRLKASEIISNAEEFLSRSASKHVVTRTFMKYGAGRIAAVVALVAFVIFGSFAIKKYFDRTNPAVLESLKEKSVHFFNQAKLSFAERGALVTEQLRAKNITIPEAVASIDDPLEKITISNGIALNLITQGRTEPAREIAASLNMTDSLFERFSVPYANTRQLSKWLTTANNFRASIALAYFYNPTPHLLELQIKNAKRTAACIVTILEKQPPAFEDISSFTIALENALNFNGFTDEKLSTAISILSPFEQTKKSDWVNAHFDRDKVLVRGYQEYGFNFNGLYQTLACAYAAKGDVGHAVQAVDSLIKYGDSYYQKDYTNMLDNATNVFATFYRAHHQDQVDAFVTMYCEHKKISELEFYQRLQGRTEPYQLTRNSHYFEFWEESENLNLQDGDEKETAFVFAKLRQAIAKLKNTDERNLLMAVSLKDEGLTLAHRKEVIGAQYNRSAVSTAFSKSMEYYKKVNSAYLLESADRLHVSGDAITSQRSSAYLWPDVVAPFQPFGPRDYHWNYMSASFLEYLVDNNLFSELYSRPEELRFVEEWLNDYHMHAYAGFLFMRRHADPAVLTKLEGALSKVNAIATIDLNILYLYLGDYAFKKNDQQAALAWYSKLKPEKFNNLFRDKVLIAYVQGVYMRLIGQAYVCFEQNARHDEAKKILGFFKNPINRSSIYAFAAWSGVKKKSNDAFIRQMLDSGMKEMGRVTNFNTAQPNRDFLALSNTIYQPSDYSIQLANSIIKNQPSKYEPLQRMIGALAYRSNLSMATQLVPDNISDQDHIGFVWTVFQGYGNGQPRAPEWLEYETNVVYNVFEDRMSYVDEGN